VQPGAPAPTTPDSNAQQQALPPAATPGTESSNAAQNNPTLSQSPMAPPRKLAAKNGGPGPAVPAALRESDNSAPSSNTAAATAPTAPSPAELDEVEHEVDQLSARSAAVDASLDRLQQQQNSAGYGLRGDIVAKRASMDSNLSKAQNALQQGDIQRAKRYQNLAETDAEALEHFLGH